jgi:hypothetical protein
MPALLRHDGLFAVLGLSDWKQPSEPYLQCLRELKFLLLITCAHASGHLCTWMRKATTLER